VVSGLDFQLFLPETILLLGGIGVLIADLFLRERGRSEVRLAWVSIVILIAALVASVAQYGVAEEIFRSSSVAGSPGMFVVDGFTTFFRIIACLTTILILLASVEYVRGRTAFRGEFFALMLLSTLAMTLMAGSTDLIMVILSLEFLSITSYILTGYLRGNPKSNEGAVKYFLFGSITTAMTFYGASLLFGIAGSTNLYDIAARFSDPNSIIGTNVMSLILPSIVFLLAGFGFKIALVPFHQWSPDAYEGAPTPVTAFLSVGPKAAGLAMLLRVMVIGLPEFEADWAAVMIGVAMVTMTLGNIVALSQWNVKRMLAYSSIAQAGYMVIGVAAVSVANIASVGLPGEGSAGLSIDGTAGVLIYIMAYLFTNVGLFVGVIAVDLLNGSETVSGFAGLIKRAPLLAIAMTIFFLSLVGIPPTAGFIGKFWVFGAALQGQLLGLALVGAVNGVISVVYYFKILKQMWYEAPTDPKPLKLPTTMNVALAICLTMTLLIGIYPQPFIEFANNSIHMLNVFVRPGA
jgi:NADH-quinone oxidoreductase subunit N